MTPRVGNHMEKNMENQMETGIPEKVMGYYPQGANVLNPDKP